MAQISRREAFGCMAGGVGMALLTGYSASAHARSAPVTRSVRPTVTDPAAIAAESVPETPSARLAASGLDQVVPLGAGMTAKTVENTVAIGSRPAAVVDTIASLADEFGAQAAGLVGRAEAHPILMLVPSTAREFQVWLDAGAASLTEVAGVTVTPLSPQLPWVVLNPNIDAATTTAAGGHHLSFEHTIAHEVFHAVTLPSGDQTAPRWLIEGAAEWASTALTGTVERKPARRPYLPTETQLYAPATGYDAYFFAEWFVAYLMKRDLGAGIDFYNKAITSPARETSPLARKYFGRSLEQLKRQWLADYDAETAGLD
ncbi:hypothetical protein [Flexivirga caeni]|uniref:Peptidase MA-like domain-containing protein n=1 Tax=Flexivirga caeni TaxID=2294115 RepID=A0A3M9MED6_9MICO|nr:hypothetical protein [Flexivirga caeni]RNI23926.1 hypothetical protein EFY87_06575 [Flexivirga caeni]